MNNEKLKRFFGKYGVFILFAVVVAITYLTGEMTLRLDYGNVNLKGQTTLYYTIDTEGFGEDKSIYSSIYNGSTEFNYDTAWNNIFIIPNREKGQSADITALKIYYGNFCIMSMNAAELADGCANLDAGYIDYNGSSLTVTASDATPYPDLKFNESFLERLSEVKKLAVATNLLLSLFITVVIYLVFYALCVLVKRNDKLYGFILKNHRLVAFNVLTFIMLFASLRHFNGFNIAVAYDTDLSGEQSTVYYDYDGNGFKEFNSTYSIINGTTGNNPFISAGDIDGLRLTPNRAVTKKAYIKSVTVYEEGIELKSYTPSELSDYYIDNMGEHIYLDGDMLVAETTEDVPYPQIQLNQYFVNELNSINMLVLATDLAKAVALYVLLALSVLAYSLGKKRSEKLDGKVKKAGLIVCALTVALFVSGWFMSVKAIAYVLAVVGVPVILFAVGAFKLPLFGKKTGYSAIAFLISSTMLFTAQTSIFYTAEFFAYSFWNMCLYALVSLSYVAVTLGLCGKADSEDSKLNDIAGLLVKAVAAVFIYEYVKTVKLYNYDSISYCFALIASNIIQLNLMWILLALCATYGLLGRGITNTLWGIVGFIIIVGNAVKISYHSTMLTPADFMQIKDMLAIAPDVIGVVPFYAIIVLAFVGLVALVFNCKRILPHLKPKLSVYVLVASAAVLVGFNCKIVSGEFSSINLCDKPYIDEVTNEQTNGVAVYNMFKVKHIPDMRMSKPSDYTEENVNKLIDEFASLKTNSDSDGVKPNVICILAESYFDLNSVSDWSFSEDIIPTTRSIGISNMVSPRYGGYTAAVEYEVLTGNSLAFYPPAVIPYTAYFTNAKRSMPSVPMEFADNGYKTYAIHPNTANFYNRDKAYSMMGFDEYYAIDAFKTASMTKNSFVKDTAVADKIISTIEDNDEPVFTFGITIESHYTDAQRFDETDIKVTGDDLIDSEINDLEQQAQAYRDLDNMIAYLKDYIDNCDEPTILYLFGDHLPPIGAFAKSSYVQDINNKYKTISLAYSNYKDVSLTDMATPNYIAAQMLVDSGVEHSSYFDFIYNLRESMPIIHKEFTDMDTTANEDLRKYYMLQYDIMFGEQWFYKNDK